MFAFLAPVIGWIGSLLGLLKTWFPVIGTFIAGIGKKTIEAGQSMIPLFSEFVRKYFSVFIKSSFYLFSYSLFSSVLAFVFYHISVGLTIAISNFATYNTALLLNTATKGVLILGIGVIIFNFFIKD